MNRSGIQTLKSTITSLARYGCIIEIPSHNVVGRVVGVGFKPLWEDSLDSKIDQLEFNIADASGKIWPFLFYNVIGYNISSYDGKRLDDSKSVSMDLYVFSPSKARDSEPYDKIRVDIKRA